MKTVTKSATVTTAFGEELKTPLKFNYTFEELEEGDKLPREMTAEEVRDFFNTKAIASARAAEQTKQLKLAGYEPKPLAENPAQQWRNFVKNLIATGKSQKDSEAMATQLTGYSPNAETVSA